MKSHFSDVLLEYSCIFPKTRLRIELKLLEIPSNARLTEGSLEKPGKFGVLRKTANSKAVDKPASIR